MVILTRVVLVLLVIDCLCAPGLLPQFTTICNVVVIKIKSFFWWHCQIIKLHTDISSNSNYNRELTPQCFSTTLTMKSLSSTTISAIVINARRTSSKYSISIFIFGNNPSSAIPSCPSCESTVPIGLHCKIVLMQDSTCLQFSRLQSFHYKHSKNTKSLFVSSTTIL